MPASHAYFIFVCAAKPTYYTPFLFQVYCDFSINRWCERKKNVLDTDDIDIIELDLMSTVPCVIL